MNMPSVNNTPHRTTLETHSQQEEEAHPEAEEAEVEAEAAEADKDLVQDRLGPNSSNGSKNSNHSERENDDAPPEARGTICIHAWNIRSLKNSTNKHAVALHLERHQPDILIITETWLDQQLTNLH